MGCVSRVHSWGVCWGSKRVWDTAKVSLNLPIIVTPLSISGVVNRSGGNRSGGNMCAQAVGQLITGFDSEVKVVPEIL